jgi:hypothetical protein
VDSGLERFPVEVSLLGLGTDIALSVDRADTAASYFEPLPAALRKLPQWQTRIERAHCLKGTAGLARSSCLSEAREGLAQQVRSFLEDNRRAGSAD